MIGAQTHLSQCWHTNMAHEVEKSAGGADLAENATAPIDTAPNDNEDNVMQYNAVSGSEVEYTLDD
jgi:hypothetical protein